MLHDLFLKNAGNETLGTAKIDITNDNVNLMGKMVNVNHFSFVSYPSTDANKAAKVALQRLIDRTILRKQHNFQKLVDQFTNIKVAVIYNGVLLNPSTTTTTTTV